MGSRCVEVLIKWENKQISNPEIPPEGIRFCPQITFDDEPNSMPMWTAEVFIRSWSDNASCYAEFRYLFNDAPTYYLKRGKRFELYDGPIKIATGEVLEGL